jgi:predicted outer membrane repeat protein
MHNEIYSNTAQQYGGGIASDTSISITLTANRVYSNTAAEDGGAISLWYGSNARLFGNEIYSNTANRDGGGIYIRDGNTDLIDNVIGHNRAWQYGGGLLLDGGEADLKRNLIQGNIAGSEAGMGLVQITATLVNNVVADNVKMGFPCASGIGIQDSTVTLMHNTIARNRGFSPGSGIYVMEPSVHASMVSLVNNILVSHTVGITVAAGNTATLEATLWGAGIWANETAWGGAGDVSTGTINVWGDPGFVHPDVGDYHINFESLAVDQGVDTGVMTDLDGDRRPIGAQSDIGADEVWRTVLLPLVLRNHLRLE